MTFFVQKSLAIGPIRFGVSPRKPLEAIDDDPALSTGASGEFVGGSADGFFFGDHTRTEEPTLPTAKSVSQTPFFTSLMPDGTPRAWGFLALLIFGALIVFLGLAVVLRKGPQGWIEVILGATMVATPIVMTAQRRNQLREQEERERIEREATEKQNREMLASYTAALQQLVSDRSDGTLDRLRKERETLTLSPEIWGAAARRTILQIGFDEIAHRGVNESAEIERLLRQAAEAAGLTTEQTTGVLHDLHRTILWHLLADDRLGEVQERQLLTLRQGFGIADGDLPLDEQAAAAFHRLRGVTAANLPRVRCPIEVQFQEQCIFEAPLDNGTLHVTNRRLVIDAKKRTNVTLPKVFDVVVDIDANLATIKTDQKKPLQLRLGDPIYTAAMIELATAIRERPLGFA